MYHLLTMASIFLKIGDGNWCQAAGPRIYELPPPPKPTAEKKPPKGKDGNKITRMMQCVIHPM